MDADILEPEKKNCGYKSLRIRVDGAGTFTCKISRLVQLITKEGQKLRNRGKFLPASCKTLKSLFHTL